MQSSWSQDRMRCYVYLKLFSINTQVIILIGSLSLDYQPIIISTNKITASCWRAFDEINLLFLFVFGRITCVFILKQLFTEGEVIIGE